MYDTIYVQSYLQYDFTDSGVKKRVVFDTLHSIKQPIPHIPMYPYKIIRIDTLTEDYPSGKGDGLLNR